MNMPAPLGYTAYRDNNIVLAKAAKSVAAKSMLDAAAELHKNSSEPITQCAVLCDGTWQQCGHASLNGCVTTLLVEWEVLGRGNFIQGVPRVPDGQKLAPCARS